MIDETAPLVSLLPTPLQELLGPDLTYLINLGYGDGSLGYSVTADSRRTSPPRSGCSPTSACRQCSAPWPPTPSKAFQNLMTDTDPYVGGAGSGDLVGDELPELMSALSGRRRRPGSDVHRLRQRDLECGLDAYSTLLPMADISTPW